MNKAVKYIIVAILLISVITIGLLFNYKKINFNLLGDDNVVLYKGDDYLEPGYKVKVGKNDVTNLVKKSSNVNKDSVGDYVVNYELVYKSKSYQKQRLVKVIDPGKPSIKLNGKSVITLYLNTSYKELGVKVYDKKDGDLTKKVKVKGHVDTTKIGTYKLTYFVTDSDNLTVSVTRTIKIVRNPNQKVIYLTFDDGPSSNTTKAILDVLKKEKVKATFFVTNKSNSLNYLIKRAYKEGHTIALHTYTHEYSKIYKSEKAYYDDLYKIQRKVKQITGSNSTIIRFPGGTSNTVSRYNRGIMTRLSKSVVKKGFRYYDWNIDSNDTNYYVNSNGVYKNVKSYLKFKSNVVLLHDTNDKYKNVEAVKKIIKYGKSKGFVFDKITTKTPMITHRPNN